MVPLPIMMDTSPTLLNCCLVPNTISSVLSSFHFIKLVLRCSSSDALPVQPAQVPPIPPPVIPPVQLSIPPAPPIHAQPIQPAHVPQLNWSHFKPEFTGKPDEDAQAHLLGMNDWMDTHAFQEGVKVQCFCLTFIGEARLWYESLRPINIDWIGLQTNSGNNILR